MPEDPPLPPAPLEPGLDPEPRELVTDVPEEEDEAPCWPLFCPALPVALPVAGESGLTAAIGSLVPVDEVPLTDDAGAAAVVPPAWTAPSVLPSLPVAADPPLPVPVLADEPPLALGVDAVEPPAGRFLVVALVWLGRVVASGVVLSEEAAAGASTTGASDTELVARPTAVSRLGWTTSVATEPAPAARAAWWWE